MKSPLPPNIVGMLAAVLALGLAASAAVAEQNRLELVGIYRYAFHEPTSLPEARTIACTEATRLAVETSRFFIDATANVVDPQLVKEMVQKVIASSLKDVQAVEQSERGRTVYCKVKGFLDPEDAKAVILTELNRGAAGEPLGIDQNRALKILSVQEGKEGSVVVVYKALKRLDWLTTAYDGSLREAADVMIEFYNDQGIPIGADKHPARIKPDGTEVMNPGEISSWTFRKPPGTKSYRVWLVK